MADSPEVADARRRAEQARKKLSAAFDELVDYGHALQSKLEPSHIARDAWDAAKNKSVDLAEDAVDAVRKRPVAATGAVAALALFIAREPLMELAGKLVAGTKGKKSKKAAKPKRILEKADE